MKGPLLPDQDETADFVSLSSHEVEVANACSVLALIGMAHVLNAYGFPIQNPASFEEVSRVLAGAKIPTVRLGYKMLMICQTELRLTDTSLSAGRELYTDSFLTGMLLGYALVDAHSTYPTLLSAIT